MTENKESTPSASGTILVVGGGISGLTAALEAAEVGYEVFLVEKEASVGGRVAQLNKYFPKLCPPTCGLEINYRRIKDNPNIKVMTLTEVESVAGSPGNYDVTLKINPRFIDENTTCCDDLIDSLETEIPNTFNFNMNTRKGLYLPHEMAFPFKYVVAPEIIGTPDAQKIKDALPEGAVDLEAQPKSMKISVGAIICHRLGTLRRHQDRQSGIRTIRQHHHQYDDGTLCVSKRPHQGTNRKAFGQ
jgi:quinone-modifying oxidoreductase subunit QmoA